MKHPVEWINDLGETVMLSAFGGGKSPPGKEVEELVAKIQADARLDLEEKLAAAKVLINDMLSTYRTDGKTTIITTERQEAWIAERDKL